MGSRKHSRTPQQNPETGAARRSLESVTSQQSATSKRSNIEQQHVDVHVTQRETRATGTPAVSIPLEPQMIIMDRNVVNNVPNVATQAQSFILEQFGPNIGNIPQEEVSLGGREPSERPSVFQNITHALIRWSEIWRSPRNHARRENYQQVTDIENNNLPDLNLPYVLCTICFRVDRKEPLIFPCNCETYISLVHRSCLIKKMKLTKINICLLCKAKYKVELDTDNSKMRRLCIICTFGIIIFVFIIITIIIRFFIPGDLSQTKAHNTSVYKNQ